MIRPIMSRRVAIALLLGVVPLAAHHSVTSEFDPSKPVTLTGKVTSVDWMNPHSYVFVDVQQSGATRNWACELANLRDLARRGFTRDKVKVGMPIRITGIRAKDGSFRIHTAEVNAATVQLPSYGTLQK